MLNFNRQTELYRCRSILFVFPFVVCYGESCQQALPLCIGPTFMVSVHPGILHFAFLNDKIK